jgi:beta-fructofuranosidase
LTLVDGRVYQTPVKELENLRSNEVVEHEVELYQESCKLQGVDGKAVELQLKDIDVTDGWFALEIGGAARLVYSSEQQIFTLERESYVDGVMEKRQTELRELNDLQIFVDTSCIEVFVNKGKQVFTARFYPAPNKDNIEFTASKQANFQLRKWKLNKVF